MTKEELLAKIKAANLETKLDSLLTDIVTSAQEINDDLLDIVADLLEISADLNLAEAEALESEAEIYQEILDTLDYLKAEYDNMIATGHAEAYQKALENVQAKIQELNQQVQQAPETPAIPEVPAVPEVPAAAPEMPAAPEMTAAPAPETPQQQYQPPQPPQENTNNNPW